MSVLVVAQSSSEIPEVLMNNPVYFLKQRSKQMKEGNFFFSIPLGLRFHFVHLAFQGTNDIIQSFKKQENMI